MNTQRVNLSLSDMDVKKLKTIYEERYLPYRVGDDLSFTGFCAMMLMFASRIVEENDYIFSYETPAVKRPGRPKNESLLDAFNKGLRGDADE